MKEAPLAGVRVLDLSQFIAGPFCTKVMGTFGAEVIKIERPLVGDIARRHGPFPGDTPNGEKSGLFLHLNTNKKSVTTDLRLAAGRGILLELLDGVSILVESFRPGVMERLGLGYDALSKRAPGLVMVSISNFGQTGPYKDYLSSEAITYATGGPMHATGFPDREPLKLGGHIIQCQAGASAALAALLSYYGSLVFGQGDHIDISLFETQAASQDRRTTQLIGYQYTGETVARRPAGTMVGQGIRPCKDGYINITGGHRFDELVKMIGREEAHQDPRFATPEERAKLRRADEFDIYYYLPWLLEHSMGEVWAIAQANHLPGGPIYTVKDLMEDPFFRARGAWQEIDHPKAGKLVYAGPPFRVSGSPGPDWTPAPLLGQHNREVLCGRLGLSSAELARLRQMKVV